MDAEHDAPSAARRALALASLGLAAAAVPLRADAAAARAGAGATGAAPTPPAGRMPSALDRLDIQDLFARYAWCYDCSDEAGWIANFTEDAIVVGANPGQFLRGREAILGWFRYLLDLRGKEGDDWLHDAYHHRMFLQDDGCLVYSYATHFNSNTSGAAPRLGVRSAGYFVSECVRREGQWLFRRHSVNRWDRTRLPWEKPLPWAEGASAPGAAAR